MMLNLEHNPLMTLRDDRLQAIDDEREDGPLQISEIRSDNTGPNCRRCRDIDRNA